MYLNGLSTNYYLIIFLTIFKTLIKINKILIIIIIFPYFLLNYIKSSKIKDFSYNCHLIIILIVFRILKMIKIITIKSLIISKCKNSSYLILYITLNKFCFLIFSKLNKKREVLKMLPNLTQIIGFVSKLLTDLKTPSNLTY